ncbi:MAG: SIS domain-containing protein [Nocardioidaceae bacterium]
MSSSTENTDFLYPFIEGTEHDPDSLLLDLAESARGKAAESARLQLASVDGVRRQGPRRRRGHGGAVRERRPALHVRQRRQLHRRRDARVPVLPPALGRAVPAWCLAADQAVVTALGNDVGFELIFSRQIIAHSKPVDIAFALSTSGNSDDLLFALTEAKRRGLLTIGFAGHDGGQMATSDDVDYCFTIRSQSIHRIQESQALIGYRLWSVVQELMQRKASAAMSVAAHTTEGAR